MRIATWNVNSIGARLPRLLPWLEERAPDVVALQETKCAADAFPTAEVAALGYETLAVGDGRWNGVAVLSRVGLEVISRELPGHPEPRYALADCGGLLTTSVYVPNGRTLDDPHYAYKLDWFATLRRTLEDGDPAAPRVIMGDFNVAPTDADVFSPAAFEGSTHVTEPERAAVRSLLGRARGIVRSPTGTTAPACSTRTRACGSTCSWSPARSRSATPSSTARPARARAPPTTPR